jgi:mRNA interferase MazF
MIFTARKRNPGIHWKKNSMAKRQMQGLRRGDIVRVQFDPTKGHEQSGVRPALVLSPEIINEHYSTIMVAAITSKRLDLILPVEALIEAPEGGLKSDSKALLLQTRCIDKSRIIGTYGSLTEVTMKAIDKALAIATGLMKI